MATLAIEPLDDQLITEACESFSGGMNSFTRASLLDVNQASLLANVTILISGELRKRLGTRDIHSGYVAGENNLIQSLLWYDSVAEDRLTAFVNGQAYYFDGLDWQPWFDADITSVTERIDSVQLTDQIYWTDSNKSGVRNFDGASVFTIPDSPVATILETHTGRLVASGVASVPDAVYFSAIFDGDSWDSTDSLRFGGGTGDPIVAIESWQDSLLVVLCKQSAYLLDASPLIGVDEMTIKKVSNAVGCAARHTVCQVGQDMWFLSRNGLMSIQKQIATSNNVISVPVSQPVQDVIQRIRWDHAHKSSAYCYNNYYVLSVPVDSNEPDTVIAFHYLTGGFSIFRGWRAITFAEQPFNGTTRLVMGCDTGEVREWLDYLKPSEIDNDSDYEDGIASLLLPQNLPVSFPDGFLTEALVVTRAMTFGDPLSKKMGWYAELEVTHNTGTLDIYAILDGDTTVRLRQYDFDSGTFTFPVMLPFTLPSAPNWVTKKIPLHHLRHFKELQLKLVSLSGGMSLRRIAVSAFMDAWQAQEN